MTRDILLALLAGGVFAAGLISYLLHTMPSRDELKTSYIEPQPGEPKGPDDLELARAVVTRFIAALADKQPQQAYALMAEPYRQSHSLEDFRTSCASSPFLAQATRATLFSTRRMLPGGVSVEPHTLQGSGVVVSNAGSINASITLLVSGSDARILVLTLAGVPVLSGVTAGAAR